VTDLKTNPQPVNKGPRGSFDNRFTIQQRILAYLATIEQPKPNADGSLYIGGLSRTGDVVNALGLPRNKSSFASVSRSLARLCKTGKVDAYLGGMCTQGKGAFYCLSASEKETPHA
jgi:hypothetical protein